MVGVVVVWLCCYTAMRKTSHAESQQSFKRQVSNTEGLDPLMSFPEQYETEDPAKREFWKSLLRIQADVAVVLAQQPVAVDRVLHFVPGIMIQFEKQCDSPLALEVKGQKIAEGEVVKVGDKFGLRITDVCEHSETWVPLVTQNSASSPPSTN